MAYCFVFVVFSFVVGRKSEFAKIASQRWRKNQLKTDLCKLPILPKQLTTLVYDACGKIRYLLFTKVASGNYAGGRGFFGHARIRISWFENSLATWNFKFRQEKELQIRFKNEILNLKIEILNSSICDFSHVLLFVWLDSAHSAGASGAGEAD